MRDGGSHGPTRQRHRGRDTGSTPYELLLGGLAACIALTLRLYANHKAITLDGVDGRIDRIQTQVAIHGTFTDAQRTRLTQVAGRCPVHKTFTSGVHVVDVVQFADGAP
jgi:putative redox protein